MPRTKQQPTPVCSSPPPIPQPGHWRIMQTLAGKVRQYAFTCSRCKVTTYMACNREMDAGASIVEHCACMGAREKPIPNSVLYKVIPNKGTFQPS